MKKLILCASLVGLGVITSCQKDEMVPEGTKPEWLGESIYEELRSGTHLDGTFNYYLRLIDDLGYAEVLSKTGSKTIFPANDEAFERFFKNNVYGVTSYEELKDGMKRQLLYSSMLDNALLTSMLSNVERDKNNVDRGVAIKHETNVSVTDTITFLSGGDFMPKNNPYWDTYRTKGINVVYDATKPMMVHFTREQMLPNNITVTGADCDFGILRGETVGSSLATSDTAYIFQTKIIRQDVTCTNGYVHQVEDVLVPPGNIPQVMRSEENTQLLSRILDYFCAPYYDATTTRNYNAWAMQNGKEVIDSIFQVRYFTDGLSQEKQPLTTDPSGSNVDVTKRLDWDLGWNQYYSSTSSLADMGAILAPTDEAIEEFFLPGGKGSYFIELYGSHENTAENLPLNLDDLHNKGNGILTDFVNNMLQGSFITSVPSKFSTLKDKGSGDFLGLTKDDIHQTADGKYDVAIANNGIIYKMSSMDAIAPNQYKSVLGPAITYPDMSIMGYFTKDKTTGSKLSIFGADMYYYLMAMKSNYLYFIPTNDAMKNCYIDPVSLGAARPRALEFYSYEDYKTGTNVLETFYGVKIHNYDPETGVIDPDVRQTVDLVNRSTSKTDFASQVYDMLNYNTVVLEAGEEPINNYYLTKHGGAIRLTDFRGSNGEFTGYVSGGAQIDNNLPPAKIEKSWKEENGYAFRLDNLIQPAIISVNKLLYNNVERFQLFIDLCALFDDTQLLEWAGITGAVAGTNAVTPQQRYFVFSAKDGAALDLNVNFFNGYNYTFYAPDNTAMQTAYEKMGLPTNDEIYEDFNKYSEAEEDDYPAEEITEAKARVLNKLNALRAFVRYHFQNNSVFADNVVLEETYQSLYSSELGIPVNITSKSNNGLLTITDEAKQTILIKADDPEKLSNKMTRDYEFDKKKTEATAISVSSFAVVHQVSTPLCYNANGRYDNNWSTPEAVKAAGRNYQQLVKTANNLKD